MVKFIFFWTTFFLFWISCNDSYRLIHDFNASQWEIHDSIVCSFEIKDVTKKYESSILLRNTLEYPYRNIFLLFSLNYNGATIQKDTLEYAITNKYGQWLGNGLGKIKNNYFILEGISEFQDTGKYELVITHGMRSEKLRGLDKLGLKIK